MKAEGAGCLGMLVQAAGEEWWLHDPDDRIRLDLSEAQSVARLGEGMLCWVEGRMGVAGETLQVSRLHAPPPQPRAISLHASHPRLFPTSSLLQPSSPEQLEQATMLIISEVQLDQNGCLEQLFRLLGTFEEEGQPPLLLILMGPFVSGGADALGLHQRAFTNLAENLVRSCPLFVQRGLLVLMPAASEDPFGVGSLLPRPPLPADLATPFHQRRIMVQLASNPCRIGFCGRELLLLRHNLARLIKPILPTEAAIPHCLIEQGWLLPVPLEQQPVPWNLQHTLTMHPLPDALVLAERGTRYAGLYAGVSYANPGAWAQSRFSFVLYHPASNKLELGRLADN